LQDIVSKNVEIRNQKILQEEIERENWRKNVLFSH